MSRVDTIERLVAQFILVLQKEGYSPVDIAAALTAAAGAVMDQADEDDGEAS